MKCGDCGKALTSKIKKVYAFIDGHHVLLCDECSKKRLNITSPGDLENKIK